MSGILQAKAAALLHDEQGTVHKDWTGKAAVAVSDPGFRAAYRHISRRPLDEVFPWDHLEVGVTKEPLARAYEGAGLA